MKKLTLYTTLLLFHGSLLYSQTITTIAGNGTTGYSGDGGQATAAEFTYPQGLAVDAAGNLYISGNPNNAIRKVNTSGVISTFAGNGTAGFFGDGGQATAAELNYTRSVAVDAAGNIYIADDHNYRVRMVNTSGVITTVAGTGTNGYSGDGGQATAAEISGPYGVAVDAAGNLYIADEANSRIRKVNTSGIISTYAGNGTLGFSGDGGQATAAEISFPDGIALDAAGNLYIADENNHRIRKVTTSGTISTFAGNGTGAFSGDGGQATNASLYYPWGVTVDAAGNVFIADWDNNRVRKVNTSGIISTFAGSGTPGFSGDGGAATSAKMFGPLGVTVDGTGSVYISDNGNDRVRKVTVVSGVNNLTDNKKVALYPNPSNGKFMLTCEQNMDKSSIEVYTMLGEKIHTAKLYSTSTMIDLSNLDKGIYLYRIITETGALVSEGKFIIQ